MPSRRRQVVPEEEYEPVSSSASSSSRRRQSRRSQYTYHHITVFVITFFSFALIHATRKTLSTVKGSMIEIWTHNATTEKSPLFPSSQDAEKFLALLDFGFLFAYAGGLYVGGVLGDTHSPRLVLSIGMWLSAIVVFLFGYATELFRIYNAPLYFVLWVSGGLFQSVGWPTEVCIIGNWFGRGSRGLVLGAWSACASVGNIIGTLIGARVVLYGYEYAFAINSVMLFAFGFVVFFGLSEHPREVGLPDPSEHESEAHDVIEVVDVPRPVGFCRAWRLPGVLSYSLAYACLKLVNYGFFFWLPFYLHSHFGWTEQDADNLSTYYDLGGIAAAIVGGALSDRFSSRTPVVVGMLLAASISLGVYAKSPGDYLINGIMLCIVGFFVGGPANMISSCVSADLGKARELRGSVDALSTVTGIVDGTGSIGAAIGMLAIPYGQQHLGWNWVFYGFIIMTLSTAGCLLPLMYKEWRQWRRQRLMQREEEEEEEEEEREGEGEPQPAWNHTANDDPDSQPLLAHDMREVL